MDRQESFASKKKTANLFLVQAAVHTVGVCSAVAVQDPHMPCKKM